jgi:hypothetical protein
MTPYNTGKVKIGSAYTPRMKPEIAHGMTGPHKARFFSNMSTSALKVALLAVIAFVVIVLSGCDITHKAAMAAQQGPIQNADPGRTLERYGPDEFGVVCYRKQSMEGIACVKVN